MVKGRAICGAIYMVNGASNMTTKNRKSKQVPPSRLRYETANPTISIRVSQELKEELEELKITSGLSLADILNAGLEKLKPDVDQFYDQGLKEGYEMGYEIAEEEFKVMATCSGCGKAHIPVVGETMKAVAARMLMGWCAKSCR